jgi:uncharacterized membrane protein YjgN (DUF898 family)
MKKHAATIFAAVLLLLPVLYVGSYLALAKPSGVVERSIYGNEIATRGTTAVAMNWNISRALSSIPWSRSTGR